MYLNIYKYKCFCIWPQILVFNRIICSDIMHVEFIDIARYLRADRDHIVGRARYSDADSRTCMLRGAPTGSGLRMRPNHNFRTSMCFFYAHVQHL